MADGIQLESGSGRTHTGVLCVDDEPRVLEGLATNLGRHYRVATALSGAAALDHLGRDGMIGVIVSDMRMPGMDGATFLAQAKTVAPDAVRMILTGQMTLDAAMAAINEGGVSRFLTKPCAPAVLRAAVDVAAEQHHALRAQTVLPQQLVSGMISSILDALSLVEPRVTTRVMRVKRRVRALAIRLGATAAWQLEAAAAVAALSTTASSVPAALRTTENLDSNTKAPASRFAAVAERALQNLPRFTSGLALADSSSPMSPFPHARVVELILELDDLEGQGLPPVDAMRLLRERAGAADEALIAALEQEVLMRTSDNAERTVLVHELRVGMILTGAITLQGGGSVAMPGFEVTASLIEHLKQFSPGAIVEPIRVEAA